MFRLDGGNKVEAQQTVSYRVPSTLQHSKRKRSRGRQTLQLQHAFALLSANATNPNIKHSVNKFLPDISTFHFETNVLLRNVYSFRMQFSFQWSQHVKLTSTRWKLWPFFRLRESCFLWLPSLFGRSLEGRREFSSQQNIHRRCWRVDREKDPREHCTFIIFSPFIGQLIVWTNVQKSHQHFRHWKSKRKISNNPEDIP